MNITTKIIIALLIFIGSAAAQPAPSMYFTESDVDTTIGDTKVLELRINTSSSSMGAETQIWYNESCVRICNINYTGSPWQPLAGTGWSLQHGYAKLATANFTGVPTGDHLFAFVEIESLRNCTSTLDLRNPQPNDLITYDTTIRGNTEMNKTIVALIAFTCIVTGAMADTVPYTVTVYEGQNTTLTVNAAAFGDMTRGSTGEINNSLTFVNDGDIDAAVDAMFKTSVNGTFGMVKLSDTIPADRFSLGPDGAEIPLLNDGSSKYISTIPAGTTVGYDAILGVPVDAVSGAYSGDVQITYG